MTGTELSTIRRSGALTPAQEMAEGPDGVWQAVKRPARRGLTLLSVGAVAFVYWGCFALLDGGAVAPGIVSPFGNKKTVQHLEGGIIAKLHVKDGDEVKVGEPLVDLESVQARSAYDILLQDHKAQLAARVRLETEKTGGGALSFPPELAGDDPVTAKIVADQTHLFRSRREFYQARRHVLNQRKQQLAEQVRGYEAQVASTTRQLELIRDELAGKKHLYLRKLTSKTEYLKVERAEAELGGRRGEYMAAKARAEEQIGEAELQLVALEAERMEQIASQLEQVRARQAEIDQRLEASKDVLSRTVIRAPVGGTVLNLKFKTVGGVVLKGEPIMEIVPRDDVLMLDARVSPNDIDVVRAGMPAMVHLTAYSNRGTPKVHGTVRSVSADRITEEGSRVSYFLARIEVEKSELERMTTKVELVPGMPAEALILTDRRSLARYLMQPFMDAWRRAFREV